MTHNPCQGALLADNGHVRVYAASLRPGEPTAHVVARLLEADPAVPARFGVAHTPEGIPFLEVQGGGDDPLPSISVSHSRSLVAVAVAPSGCPVGVDAETTGRDRQLRRVAPRFLSGAQLPRWSADPAMLLRAWTLKEALYKAALTPGMPMDEIPLPEEGEGSVELRGRRYATAVLPSPYADNVISLAYLADSSFNV